MSSIDALAEQMADRIDGSYDCVDRIVLNAYFTLGMSPGGFRTWWRQLFGSDENLDDNHLMRMAGRFSRRLRAFADRHAIPVIDATSGKNKRMHRLAEAHHPDDPDFTGLFCITISRAPAPVWKVRRFGNGGIDLARKTAWVNHYSFHIIDAEWGHVTFKLCGHAPFSAQIMLNGHEFIARQLPRWGIDATQAGNCFTETSDAAGLSQRAETSCFSSTIGRLWQVCERWISSSCLCFALSTDEQQASDFHYDLAEAANERQSSTLTVRQAAYDLSKFRAKDFVERIAGTHRYQLCTDRVRPLAALFVLRENVIHPLISRQVQLQRGPRPKHQTPIDIQYHRLQREMQKLFKLLHIAA